MTWLPVALSAVETVAGLVQKTTNKRPQDVKYQIPAEVQAYLGELKNRATQGMPGYDLMLENILSQGAGQTTALKDTAASGASLQGSVNQLSGNVMSGLRDVDIMNSKFKDSAKVDYAGGLMQMAAYKDKQWNFNVNQPHIQAMTEYFNKDAAANENIWGGVESMAQYSFMNNMDSIGGTGTTGAGSGKTGNAWQYGYKGTGFKSGVATLPQGAQLGTSPGTYRYDPATKLFFIN